MARSYRKHGTAKEKKNNMREARALSNGRKRGGMCVIQMTFDEVPSSESWFVMETLHTLLFVQRLKKTTNTVI
jgi:hypothetical protein